MVTNFFAGNFCVEAVIRQFSAELLYACRIHNRNLDILLPVCQYCVSCTLITRCNNNAFNQQIRSDSHSELGVCLWFTVDAAGCGDRCVVPNYQSGPNNVGSFAICACGAQVSCCSTQSTRKGRTQRSMVHKVLRVAHHFHKGKITYINWMCIF